MVTQSDVTEYGNAVDGLATLALRDVRQLLVSLADTDPVVARNALIAALPEVVGPYLTASGDLAATWYEDLRAQAVGGQFYATSAAAVNDAQVEGLVRWGVRPLFGASEATALSLIGGGVQRMVAGAGRDTVVDNVMRDRVRVGWARIPRAGCCAFCGMLASRGATYNTREASGAVVGRGVAAALTAGKARGQGRGVKARGSRTLGSDKFHDFCRCRSVPVFTGDTFHEEVQQKYLDLYTSVESADGSTRPLGAAVQTKSVLADWRSTHGAR